VILMRDIFTEIFENQPLDPRESARRGARPKLRKRFYSQAHVGEAEAGGFPDEWNAQADLIDPARMPLTRLANAVIDAVADALKPVADEVAQYLGSDLLCYRADAPPGLVERQTQAWDPVLEWAREALGARFVLAQGIVHVAQPSRGGWARCL
jgi:chaperone required for assembly of F1-ATPase